MYVALGVALLLLAFGSKIAGVLIGGVLLAIHKVGLLRNVRVGSNATLSVTIRAVHISVWRNVWGYLHSPTQEPLITVDFSGVHLLVLCRDEERHRQAGGNREIAKQSLLSLMQLYELDSSTSLKRLDHPVWKGVQSAMHRVPLLWLIIPAIGLTSSEISLDIVQEVQNSNQSTVHVEKGYLSVRSRFRQISGEVEFVVQVCPEHEALVSLPGIGIDVTLRSLSFGVSVPISRDADDIRAPVPSFAHVQCESLRCSLDLVRLLRGLNDCTRGAVGDCQSTNVVLTILEMRHALPLRLMEMIPAITIKLGDVQLKVAISLAHHFQATLDSVQFSIVDPLGPRNSKGGEVEEQVVERRVVLAISCLSVVNSPKEHVGQSTSLSLSELKVEADNRLVHIPHNPDQDADSTAFIQDGMSWSTHCSGETRGLSIVLGPDVSEVIDPILAAIPPTNRGFVKTGSVHENFPLKESTWEDYISVEIQAQLKLSRTEILCLARDNRCPVFPNGVPDIGLHIDEISLMAFPFVAEESLGIRARADIHGSRLQLFYVQRTRTARSTFMSIDGVRLLCCPVLALGLNPNNANVDMEAEWLEVRWSPEAMHAIGGMLELGVLILRPLLYEHYDWTEDDYWAPQAFLSVQSMRSMAQVVDDHISNSETIKFRCKVRHSLVLFTHSHAGGDHIESVSVDTLNVSVEETTGRFRLSIIDTRICHVDAISDTRQSSERLGHHAQYATTSRCPAPVVTSGERRRKVNARQDRPKQRRRLEPKPFFNVRTFALEENKLPFCPMTVLDLFVDGVTCQWDMKTQDRIVELIRRITFSAWEMLYRFRSTYGVYCTSSNSRYKRAGGINGTLSDLTQCLTAEQLSTKLISASGDTLNRIRATSIALDASFGERSNLFDVQLSVGVFESQDLPELWTFENVRVVVGGSLDLVQVNRICVRHTVDKRSDYVFGFFEATLWLRQLACGKRESSSPRKDGMMVEIDGLRIGLSRQLDMIDLASESLCSISPFLTSHMKTLQANWRPQEDIFFLYFLRIPKLNGQPKVWLSMSNCEVNCDDNPMETWLERVYPVWIEELAEQELRAQLLEEQLTSLKLANPDITVSDLAAENMRSLLREKNSKSYYHKMSRATEILHCPTKDKSFHEGKILSIRASHIVIEISPEPIQMATNQLVRELDEATAAIDRILTSARIDPALYSPRYSFLIHQHINVSVLDLCVRMRSFLTPIAAIDQLTTAGDVVVAVPQSPRGATDSFEFTASLRCYGNLDVTVRRPVLFFGPSYVPTIKDLVAVAEKLLPTVMLDVDRVHHSKLWDIARRVLHGRLHAVVEDVSVRLLAASTTFEAGGYLELGVHHVDLRCRRGQNAGTEMDIEQITLRIQPDALVNIAEITSLTIKTQATWTSKLEPSIHYILPVVYQKDGGMEGETAVIDFQSPGVWQTGRLQIAERLEKFRGVDVVCSLWGIISPKTSPLQLTRREIASRSAIVLYTKHVEWLIQFGRVYEEMVHRKFPSRCRQRQRRIFCPEHDSSHDIVPPVEQFLQVFRGVTVSDFGIVGVDFALYHSEKSQVGIRACINDLISVSGTMVVRSSANECTRSNQARHVSVEWKKRAFVLEAAAIVVRDVQVRICTPSSGSRGESLVSIRYVSLNVGEYEQTPSTATSQFDFAKLHAEFDQTSGDNSRDRILKPLSRPASSLKSPSFDVKLSTDVSRTKSKRTILEHFAIAQPNPYRYRDDVDEGRDKSTTVDVQNEPEKSRSDSSIHTAFVEEFRRQGYLLGLAASEIRVLVTLDTVETMVDIVENWIRVVRSSFPEFYSMPDELLSELSAHSRTIQEPLGLESPKKATSLADDPRFGPIFHASNPLPTNKVPSFSISSSRDETHEDQSSNSPSDGVVLPFMAVRFLDCQVSFHDRQNKGSVLIALSCGRLHHSRSQDIKHELVDLKVDGLQLLTAPLDIDVRSRVIWLRTLDDGFTYCPSSFGLLKRVVAPIPTKLMIWIDRNLTVTNRVDLNIPSVQINVTIDSKIILEDLIVSLLRVITAKLADYQLPDYPRVLHVYQGFQNATSIRLSLQQLIDAKKELKWKIAGLHWRHMCRWNYRVVERTNLAMQAVEGVRVHTPVESDMVPSPFVHGPRLSSVSFASLGTSISLTGSTATQVEPTPDELQRLQQEFESIGEVLRSLVNSELAKRQPNPNVQLTFILQAASLTLSSANSDIVSAAMTNLKVKLKMYENQSGSFGLTIQDVCCKNLCPNTPYPDLLIPHRGSKSWSGDEMFVRVDADVAPPIGEMKVVRHFEVNVHPMQVCVSYDLILQLVAFFTTVSTTTSRQDVKKEEVRSQFLSAPQAASSITGEGLLRRAVKVAGKAAHPLTQGLGRQRVDGDHDHQPSDARVKVVQALQEEATHWISKIARLEPNRATINGEEAALGADKGVNSTQGRITSSILFKRIRLGTVEVMVSFKNKKSNPAAAAPQQLLEDMRGFEVKIHSLVYLDKTCSLMDLLLRIRRDVILDVLSQVGRNFTNVANFLRDQLDITRWGAFDALAPLKSLSTAITGSVHPPCLATPSSTTPDSMAEMLQRRPRISHDGGRASTTSPSPRVDTSKVFQLELPESHPSRRKKLAATHTRPSEPTNKIDTTPNPDNEETVTPTSGGKPKKMLSGLFGKSKKPLQPDDGDNASH